MEFEEKLREYACVGDEEGVRQLILKQGVNINSQNAVNTWTALHWAAKRGHVGLTSFLLSHGADRTINTTNGETALDLATHPSVRSLLGDAGAGGATNGSLGRSTELPIVPNYIAYPQFPHMSHDNYHEELPRSETQKQTQGPSSHSKHMDDELVLRVRLANSSETDFLEIELDKTQLTYQVLLNTMCSELDVDPRVVINKVRKLPNIIVRKDKDVRRLVDFQELELFITESALIRQYPLPKLDF